MQVLEEILGAIKGIEYGKIVKKDAVRVQKMMNVHQKGVQKNYEALDIP